MSSRRNRSSKVSRLFYGRESSDDSDASLVIDVDGDDDDSVDDPDFVYTREKEIGGGDNEESSDDGDREGGDDDRERGNIATSASVGDNDGEGSSAGPSVGGGGGGVLETPRARRQRGKERVKVGRVRVRGEWANEKARRLRNSGQAYASFPSGKQRSGRKIGQPCKDGCFTKVGQEAINDIFDGFWALGNYDKQNAYLSQRVRSVPVKRKYTKKEVSKRVNYEYTVKHYEETFKVCRNGFLAMHDLSEKRLLLHVKRMKESPTGTPVSDKRGKAPNPKKITGVKLQNVHEHIANLPTTSSHYTRAKSPHRRYLESGGSIRDLYNRYISWMNENYRGEEKVTGRFYEKVFTENYNIGFQPPKKDTCSYCDLTQMHIAEKKRKNEDTSELERELEAHQRKAKNVQELLSSQRDLVQSADESAIRVVAMDLQQTLPCPRLSTGVAYYLRKLWVYNFCIYDITQGRATMFVWDETMGGRGSDEVASCLMKWLDMRQGEGQEIDVLRIFCDNCGGQNKNINVVLAALRLVHAKKLMRAEFVYMVSGHSYMPCDRAFGNIEKKLRGAHGIVTTEHYVEIIRAAVNPPFETIAMKREEFLDVKVLLKYITKRPTPVPFSSACQLVCTYRYKEGYFIKTDYDFNDMNTNVNECRVMKTNRRYSAKLFNLSEVQLPIKYETERLLNPLKTKNLESLMAFLGAASKQWYKDLIARQKQLQKSNLQASCQDEEDVGSDCENDLMDYDDPIPLASLQ